MHITIATHFCGGEIAATKVSLAGIAASCGMESDKNTGASSEASLASNCCTNEFAVYSVNSDYAPAEFQVRQLTQNLLHECYIPEAFAFQFNNLTSITRTDVSPPDNFFASAVSMAGICVFRI